jgi:hypothetical protein
VVKAGRVVMSRMEGEGLDVDVGLY